MGRYLCDGSGRSFSMRAETIKTINVRDRVQGFPNGLATNAYAQSDLLLCQTGCREHDNLFLPVAQPRVYQSPRYGAYLGFFIEVKRVVASNVGEKQFGGFAFSAGADCRHPGSLKREPRGFLFKLVSASHRPPIEWV